MSVDVCARARLRAAVVDKWRADGCAAGAVALQHFARARDVARLRQLRRHTHADAHADTQARIARARHTHGKPPRVVIHTRTRTHARTYTRSVLACVASVAAVSSSSALCSEFSASTRRMYSSMPADAMALTPDGTSGPGVSVGRPGDAGSGGVGTTDTRCSAAPGGMMPQDAAHATAWRDAGEASTARATFLGAAGGGVCAIWAR
jgi:hypothetical protein